jgi:hypothetical protein
MVQLEHLSDDGDHLEAAQGVLFIYLFIYFLKLCIHPERFSLQV